MTVKRGFISAEKNIRFPMSNAHFFSYIMTNIIYNKDDKKHLYFSYYFIMTKYVLFIVIDYLH